MILDSNLRHHNNFEKFIDEIMKMSFLFILYYFIIIYIHLYLFLLLF